MKFSFEISRSSNTDSLRSGGRLMGATTAQPDHAALIRETTAANRKMLRMYEGAVTNNLNLDFQPTVGSANAEILNSLYMVRGRSRTLVKDFATARGILRNDKNNVCGDDPFRLEMRVGSWSADGKTFTPETETNREIKDWWAECGRPENCTVRRDMSRMEMYQCVEASAFRDGNIMARHHRLFPNNENRYAIELVDSDRLQESYMGKAPVTGNQIRFSIERDQYNAAVAYWILTRHPGDMFGYNGTIPNTWRERVPSEDIIHFKNLRDRAEQDIGFPEMDSLVQPLHRDRQFDIAHVSAAIWAACKPFFITQDYPTGMNYNGDPSILTNQITGPVEQTGGGAITQDQGDGRGGGVNKYKVQQPATGEILPLGFKPMLLDPKFPIEAATSFKRDNLLQVASGSGQSYGAVSSDYEKYSFSTARFAEEPQRLNYRVRQQHMVLNFVRQHFEESLKYGILSGQLSVPMSRYKEVCRAASFKPKRWPYVNPVQDVQSDIELQEAGLKSPQETLAESENGRDIEEVYAEIAEAREIAKSHGLDFVSQIVTKPSIPKSPGEPGDTKPDTMAVNETTETLQKNRLNGNGIHH